MEGSETCPEYEITYSTDSVDKETLAAAHIYEAILLSLKALFREVENCQEICRKEPGAVDKEYLIDKAEGIKNLVVALNVEQPFDHVAKFFGSSEEVGEGEAYGLDD